MILHRLGDCCLAGPVGDHFVKSSDAGLVLSFSDYEKVDGMRTVSTGGFSPDDSRTGRMSHSL
jgi:hypothetical protein